MRGMTRRKAQTYGSASVAGCGRRLSARQSQTSIGTGPRFSLPDEAGRSAGSQDLVVGPGEPRHRPGARPCVSRPQAPHLVPLHERLMIAPFKWTRWLQCKRVLEGGDKIGLAQNHCREEREAKLADTISRERRSANMELSVRQALHEHVGRGGLT